jgi:hypothetical protein
MPTKVAAVVLHLRLSCTKDLLVLLPYQLRTQKYVITDIFPQNSLEDFANPWG